MHRQMWFHSHNIFTLMFLMCLNQKKDFILITEQVLED